jgi:hypothetical protein
MEVAIPMKSNISKGLESKVSRSKIFKTSLAIVLIVFAFTMSSPSSFFQFVKPVEAAGTLTSIGIFPANNIVNTRTTYDITFKTATTGTIKIIQMSFPSGFDVSAATRYLERSGIGSGSLSAQSSTNLIYTVTNPVSVPAGTIIRLEIGRIVNSDTAGSFKVIISTFNTGNNNIDFAQSPSFPIKDITGDDVSTGFMIRKTLKDDTAGHGHAWNPNFATTNFVISDSDISGSDNDIFVSVGVTGDLCTAGSWDTVTHNIFVHCATAPGDGSILHYLIIKLPPHVVTSSLAVSSSESTSSAQSTSSQDLESVRAHDQIASEFP